MVYIVVWVRWRDGIIAAEVAIYAQISNGHILKASAPTEVTLSGIDRLSKLEQR